MINKRLLLVEDDSSLGYLIKEYLLLQGFLVSWVKSGEEAIKELNRINFHLAILDIMLPGIDGFELAQRIKTNFNLLPFIFLSAKSMRVEKLKGYNLGAFDYVTKPVDEQILVAKINAIIELTTIRKENDKEKFKIGRYIYSPHINELVIDSEVVRLSNKENELLKLLILNKDSILLRDYALKEIWGEKSEFTRKTMDVFISKLRKYLQKDQTISIKNIHGKGFILFC